MGDRRKYRSMSNKKIWWIYHPKSLLERNRHIKNLCALTISLARVTQFWILSLCGGKSYKKNTLYFKMRMKKRRWLGWKMGGESFTVNPNFRTKYIVGMHYLDAYIPHTLDNHGGRNQAIARATLLTCVTGPSLLSKDSIPSVFKEQDYHRSYRCCHN